VATATTPHSGAIPSITTTAQGGFGGPGGGPGGGFPGGGPGGGFRRAFAGGALPGGALPGGAAGRGFPGGGFAGGTTSPFGGGTGVGRAFGGGGGGFLNASTSNAALTKKLQAGANSYTWVAATVNSNNAAGYQLASGDPVMAIGGFNGTDPSPTLAQFETYVSDGKIHYYIAAGGGIGRGGGAGGSSNDASAITSWVESHFTAETVGGVTIYDLTSGSS
jgi:hypothetical protein